MNKIKKFLFLLLLIFSFPSQKAQALCHNFEHCTTVFLSALESFQEHLIKKNTHEIELNDHAISGSDDTILTAAIKHKSKTESIIVFVSGIHGIEGLIGSTIQTNLLQNYFLENMPSKTDLFFIHLINPSGTKNFRRVNSNNVDLNRNFPTSENSYKTQNLDYLEMNSFLNPQKPVNTSLWAEVGFLWNSLKLIFSTGIEPLRRGILRGQYQNDSGVYYGGKQPEPETLTFQKIITSVYNNYSQIMLIDLHSGYGEKSKLHLFPSTTNPNAKKDLEKIFRGFPINFGDQKNFYQVTGSMTDWVEQKAPPTVSVKTMVFEYGTMNSQKVWGSLQSLYSVILENQNHFWGNSSSIDSDKIRNRTFDLYAPQSPEWEKSVHSQTENALDILLQNWPTI